MNDRFNEEISEYINYITENLDFISNKYPIMFLTALTRSQYELKNNTLIIITNNFNLKFLKNYENNIYEIFDIIFENYNIENIEYKVVDKQQIKANNIPKNVVESPQKEKNNIFVEEGYLSENYTLESFIYDETNSTAYSITSRICNSEYDYAGGKLFVFYGPTGVGKTHLMCAILNAFKNKYEGKSAYYFVKEYWVRILKESATTRNYENFLTNINKADIIIIDDLSFICDTNKAFYIKPIYDLINRRITKDKITLITTPIHPQNIKLNIPADQITDNYFKKDIDGTIRFGDPFMSRLTGNIVNIEKPSFTLKKSFLKRMLKAELQKDMEELNEKDIHALDIIIENCSDFRGIKGIIDQLLHNYVTYNDIHIAINRLYKTIVTEKTINAVSVNDKSTRISYLFNKMLETLNLDIDAVKNVNKNSKTLIYRDLIIYILNKYHECTLTDIAKYLNVTKPTCHYAIKRIVKQLNDKNNPLYNEIQIIHDKLLKT